MAARNRNQLEVEKAMTTSDKMIAVSYEINGTHLVPKVQAKARLNGQWLMAIGDDLESARVELLRQAQLCLRGVPEVEVFDGTDILSNGPNATPWQRAKADV